MGLFKIGFNKSAEKELRNISQPFLSQILRRIEKLAHDPRPAGYEKLKGNDRHFRIRQGDYRIIYDVQDLESMVIIIRIGHRREVYS